MEKENTWKIMATFGGKNSQFLTDSTSQKLDT